MSNPPKKKTDIEQLQTLVRANTLFTLVSIIAMGIALVIFVSRASADRGRICDVVEKVTIDGANALVAAANSNPPEEPRTPEEEARRQRSIEIYLEGIDESLEGCR